MNPLYPYRNTDIDWNLSPEQAVTMYLEWGNNNWHAEYGPVRSKADMSVYFVVDTWERPPMIRLVRRTSENAEDLITIPLPAHLQEGWHEEYGSLRGVFEPSEPVKSWLKERLEEPE